MGTYVVLIKATAGACVSQIFCFVSLSFRLKTTQNVQPYLMIVDIINNEFFFICVKMIQSYLVNNTIYVFKYIQVSICETIK